MGPLRKFWLKQPCLRSLWVPPSLPFFHAAVSSFLGTTSTCVDICFVFRSLFYTSKWCSKTFLLHGFLHRFVSASIFFDVVCRIEWKLVVYMWNACFFGKIQVFWRCNNPFMIRLRPFSILGSGWSVAPGILGTRRGWEKPVWATFVQMLCYFYSSTPFAGWYFL